MERVFSLDAFRLTLPLFVCISAFGLPTIGGIYLQYVCSFASIAFFILSGFLVVSETPFMHDRLVRAIKRTTLMFVGMAIFYFLLNLAFVWLGDTTIEPYITSGQLWFEFLAFNYWPFPVGETIWFIQCLLYGYLAVYLLEKLKLLRYDWMICILCITFAVVSGEFAKLTGFELGGYSSLPATVFTRSLPYLLLGRIIHRYAERLRSIPTPVLICTAALGVVGSIFELAALAMSDYLIYAGHLLGNGLLATSVIVLMLQHPYRGAGISAAYARLTPKITYIFHQPLSYGLLFLVQQLNPENYTVYSVMRLTIVLGLCYLISWAIYRKSSHYVKKERTRYRRVRSKMNWHTFWQRRNSRIRYRKVRLSLRGRLRANRGQVQTRYHSASGEGARLRKKIRKIFHIY